MLKTREQLIKENRKLRKRNNELTEACKVTFQDMVALEGTHNIYVDYSILEYAIIGEDQTR